MDQKRIEWNIERKNEERKKKEKKSTDSDLNSRRLRLCAICEPITYANKIQTQRLGLLVLHERKMKIEIDIRPIESWTTRFGFEEFGHW